MNLNKIWDLKLNEIIIFLMGMFSTMPIVCLKISGHYISFFTVFFIFTILYFIANIIFLGTRLNIGKNSSYVIIWFLLAILSSLFGWIYFQNEPEWRQTSVSYISKLIIYIVFAFLWINQKGLKRNTDSILYGLLFGCILNLFWAVIDGIGFYIFGISLNNLVFHSYAVDNNIRYETVSLIVNGLIRASGFNYDPAHIGFIAPVVLTYSIFRKKGWLFCLAFLAIICSASTTALVCSIVIILFNLKKIRLYFKTKKSAKYVVLLILLCLIILLIFSNSFNTIFGVVKKFFDRITNTYGKLSSDDPRLIYWTQFFNGILIAGVMCFVGTGFGTASYAYVFDESILKRLGYENFFPYDMEMTYISYFFDLGIFGFAIYIFILYKLLRSYLKSDSEDSMIISALICGIILSSFFYHYTLMATHVLVIIVGMGLLDFNKKEYAKTALLELKA